MEKRKSSTPYKGAVAPADVKGYVWAYWCLARQITGFGVDDASRVMQAVLLSAIPIAEPEGAKDAFGFSPSRSAIWIRPNRLAKSGIPIDNSVSNPGLVFYPSRPSGRDTAKALAQFPVMREFELWRSGKLPLTRKLLDAELEVLSSLRSGPVRYEGVLIFGRDPAKAGLVWFGVRHEIRWAQLDPKQQGLLLSRPPAFLRATAVPEGSWVVPNEFALHENLAREIAEATFGGAVVTVPQSDARLFVFASGGTRIAATSLCLSEAEGAVLEAVAQLKDRESVDAVELVAHEQLAGALRLRPWLWSRHLGPHDVRVLAPRDWAGLVDALTNEPPAIDPDDLTAGPVSRIAGLSPGATVAIHGRLGTGKTICLYQLARRFRPEDLLVVVKPNAANEHRPWLDDLLRDWSGTVTFLLDDLDRDGAGWLAWISGLRGRTEKDGNSRVAILTTYAQEETHLVRERFSRELQDFDHFCVHDTNVLMSVGVRATRNREFRRARERLIDVWGVRAWSPSVRQLLEAIPELNREDFAWPGKRGWLPPLPEQQRRWTAKFRRLARDSGASDRFALLVLVRVFYWADAFFVSDSLNGRTILESAFTSLVTNDTTRFHAAWAALQDDWLMPNEAAGIAYVDLRDAEVLDQYSRPTPVVREFLNWMMNGGGHFEWREIMLDRLSQRVNDAQLANRLHNAYVEQLRHRRDTDPDSWNGAIDDASLELAERRIAEKS